MSFAARVSDSHVCPMTTGTVPHVGGSIIGANVSTVLINNLPAAVVGDSLICVGATDTIAMGSTSVFICSMQAARMGDTCSHGGSIVLGSTDVMIGG